MDLVQYDSVRIQTYPFQKCKTCHNSSASLQLPHIQVSNISDQSACSKIYPCILGSWKPLQAWSSSFLISVFGIHKQATSL